MAGMVEHMEEIVVMKITLLGIPDELCNDGTRDLVEGQLRQKLKLPQDLMIQLALVPDPKGLNRVNILVRENKSKATNVVVTETVANLMGDHMLAQGVSVPTQWLSIRVYH